jgi:ABC-2 type transport system permease protein
MQALLRLTWLETKIFAREPLGLVGSLLLPVVAFIGLGRALGGLPPSLSARASGLLDTGLPVFASILIALNAVTSLVTIVSIYREGGILKRLRATPLTPATILAAHVLVKLLFTALTLALMVLAGRRYYPVDVTAPLGAFTLALIVSTWSILSIGFVIASVVPTARFAQPITAFILYPMLALSGLFAPIAALPPLLRAIAWLNPLTYAVSLLRGIWIGEGWAVHLGDLAALAAVFAVCTAAATRVFRWQ